MTEIITRQIKLVTGEEILCTVLKHDRQTITVTNACKVVYGYNDDDELYVSLVPFMTQQYNIGCEYVLNGSAVVASGEIADDLVSSYIEAIRTFTNDPIPEDKPDNVISFNKDKNRLH